MGLAFARISIAVSPAHVLADQYIGERRPALGLGINETLVG